MRKWVSILCAGVFTAALLLWPLLHTHGRPAADPCGCGAHGEAPAPAPADGAPHDDCPACHFAATAAVAAAPGFDAAPVRLPAETAVRLVGRPARAFVRLLPPSCGPPRA